MFLNIMFSKVKYVKHKHRSCCHIGLCLWTVTLYVFFPSSQQTYFESNRNVLTSGVTVNQFSLQEGSGMLLQHNEEFVSVTRSVEFMFHSSVETCTTYAAARHRKYFTARYNEYHCVTRKKSRVSKEKGETSFICRV
jgi:hypothetical protein